MPRTAKTAQQKTACTAQPGEGPDKLKTPPPVVGTPAENEESASTKNSSIAVIAEPETSTPAEATTSSVPATITPETVYPTTIKPLFFTEQPSRRSVPPLSPEDYEALKANIQELGRILVPISITPQGIVIDGYARLQIAGELNLFCPWIVENIGTDQIGSLARTLNLARRQLSAEQKRQLIADELVEDAEGAKLGEARRSFNMVAKKLGVACNTVISVSLDLIQSGKISPITEAIGSDGKLRKAPRPREPRSEVITGASPAKAQEVAAPSITAPTATSPAATARGSALVTGTSDLPESPKPIATAAPVTRPQPVPAKIADDSGEFVEEDIIPTVSGPEPREQYLPEEHPLTEAVREIFRAEVSVNAPLSVASLLRSDPTTVTLDDVDILIRRCGLGAVTIAIGEPQGALAIASA